MRRVGSIECDSCHRVVGFGSEKDIRRWVVISIGGMRGSKTYEYCGTKCALAGKPERDRKEEELK